MFSETGSISYREKHGTRTLGRHAALIQSNHDSEKDAVILKILAKYSLAPYAISLLMKLDIVETQQLVGALLERGLVSASSDGFSCIFGITKSGQEAIGRKHFDQEKTRFYSILMMVAVHSRVVT